jgi:hypothetical protein
MLLSLLATCSPMPVALASPGTPATAVPASGRYLGQSPPRLQPQVFLPGIVSTRGVDLLAVMAPNGRELLFSRLDPARGVTVLTLGQREDATWTAPEVAPFSGRWSDFAVSFAPDGHRLWFVSNRPRTPDGEPQQAQDIWYVERSPEGAWSAPIRPGPPVNSDDRDLSPCETSKALFFDRVPGGGRHDILRVPVAGDAFGEPETITSQLGLAFSALEPAVPADERFIVFVGMDGPDEAGGFDLYVTFRLGERRWSAPISLGSAVNTPANEHFPTLSPDGAFLFFVSDRAKAGAPVGGAVGEDPDVYWVSTEVIERRRPR